LATAGHIADKVVLLEAPHTLLLNRVKYRRIDYSTGQRHRLYSSHGYSWTVHMLGGAMYL